MSVELRHLRAFVAVAEELNFTRAAARLHLAQQALSAQIRQLETLIGTPLFVRTTRKVELTGARLVTVHNLTFVAKLMERLRAAVAPDRLDTVADDLARGTAPYR